MAITIPLPTDEELSAEAREVLAALPPLNVFRMMAAVPSSFRPLLDFAASLLLQGAFDPRQRELAILRVAHVTRAPYEWTQHARLARNLGVTDAEITAIAVDGPVTGLDADGALLCRVADEISRDVRLSDAALDALVRRYGVRLATELILCVSYFNMLSRFLESTRVPLEGVDVLGARTPADIGHDAGRG